VLKTPDTPWLTVQRISQHLGVREWSIARELKLGAEGKAGRLKGEKVTGSGNVGQGGRWQVHVNDYVTWLGVSDEDREYVGEDKLLPLLYPFREVAENEKITMTQLKDFVEGNGLDHIQAGRNRYFTHLQRVHFETLHRAKVPAP
jgi:hypothetical protein